MFSSHIFRANDIRGIWNKDFDISFTKDLAYGMAFLAKKNQIKNPKILIGHDARLSSPLLFKNLALHLKKQGFKTAKIGLAPSPLCYFLMNYYAFSACVVVTASHNPKEFNGFKILFHKKHQIQKPIADLKRILSQKKKKEYIYSHPGVDLKISKEKAYLDSLKKEFKLNKMSFVIDTGNGALGPLAKKAFKSLGLKVKILFEKPDGHFKAHHPDPTVKKNLVFLNRELKKGSYPFGLAFDGDGDRLVLLKPNGEALLGDELGFILLKSLEKKKNSLVLADVKCSDWFFKLARKEGFRVKMIRSGHALARTELEKTGAVMAVEFSGHIFFNDRKGHGFDDALYASLRWIEKFQSQNKSLEEFIPLSKHVATQEIRITKTNKEIQKAISQVQSYLQKRGESFNKKDGIRLSRKDSWALFRSSKTQSVLSMRFGAKNLAELKRIKKEFSKHIGFSIP